MRNGLSGLLILMLFQNAACAASTNLVQDGGFETPVNLSGTPVQVYNRGDSIVPGIWTVESLPCKPNPCPAVAVNTSSAFSVNNVRLAAREGSQSLNLGYVGKGINAGVSQVVTTKPGETYRLSFWVGNAFHDPGATIAEVLVLINTTPLMTALNSGGDSAHPTEVWQEFTASFVAKSNTTKLVFDPGEHCTSPTDQCGLDDVRLTRQ